MAFRGIADQSGETVMGSQRGISLLCFGMFPKTIFYSNFTIVEDDFSRNSAQNVKSVNERVQETLFILMTISKYNRPAAVTEPDTEKIDSCFPTIKIDGSFPPSPPALLRRARIEAE